MAKKLHYFDVNGIGESIRYILHYGGQKFEDVRYQISGWPDKKVKDALPFGQLPLYEEGDRSLHQSLAIARYVASQSKLLPNDLWEQAVVDSYVMTIYDFWFTKVIPFVKETDAAKKATLKKEILDESIHFFFSRFDKVLKEHNGFFIGKLTWAEFILVGIIEAGNLFLDYEIEKNYPHVKAAVQKVLSLPGVKEYIAKRKVYAL
ncbi:unnamed protein product [Plutella xylostella]|uniref:glutathione transferase n=1 Tax=Plutella xylostella TaxID=51655 RepID=Q6F443_PLUXY|nr:glutathione S-transferase-like [Plutella xylostella]BAD26691.1 Glutathione S-transferase [Plutella xylostella]BAE80116.1 glutathione S-transferase [Plutella xylostella]CAG9135355.1 unnamed protein product [Plutella xylostella]